MRIRKRQVRLPLSSLCPVPLSDPLLHDLNYSPPPSMVQLHDPTQQPNPSHPVEQTAHVGHPRRPQPSDRPNQRLSTIQVAGEGKGSGFSDASGEKHKQVCGLELMILKGEEDERGSRDGEESDDIIRKEMILGAETLAAFASGTSSSSHPGAGRWFEGEKAFPLKKRRGSFERRENNTIILDDDHHQKDKKLMKTKIMNKKGSTQKNRNDDDGEAKQGLGDHDHANIVNSNASAMRKRARGSGAIMEGSRCSRVNGRGWRCCQQTLVGYSLCEHHLGKGRLRSMSNVRSRSTATTTTTRTTSATSAETEVKRLLASSRSYSESKRKEDAKAVVLLDDDRLDHENYGGEEVEEKPLVATKRRMKLGIVKARSMSSLLGQTNTNSSAIAPVAPSADHDEK